MQIGILESSDFSSRAISDLSKIGNIECFDGEDINLFIQDKDILFVRLKYYIGKSLLFYANKLKYLCTPTTGLNHIDLNECRGKNIQVLSLKGELEFLSTIRATPEHTFGLTLALLRNYKNCFLNKTNRTWNRELYKGFELYGKKIGIIGYGRVGKIISNYFIAFGCSVSYFDIEEKDSLPSIISKASIEEVIRSSDIVLLTASYSEENYEFFDKKYIDLLGGKYFINTARGELLDELYLLKKIKENFFAGVALDVIQNETKQENILYELTSVTSEINLLISPHIAGATYESMWKTEEFICNKLKEVI